MTHLLFGAVYIAFVLGFLLIVGGQLRHNKGATLLGGVIVVGMLVLIAVFGH